jgi:hypothetical protein
MSQCCQNQQAWGGTGAQTEPGVGAIISQAWTFGKLTIQHIAANRRRPEKHMLELVARYKTLAQSVQSQTTGRLHDLRSDQKARWPNELQRPPTQLNRSHNASSIRKHAR